MSHTPSWGTRRQPPRASDKLFQALLSLAAGRRFHADHAGKCITLRQENVRPAGLKASRPCARKIPANTGMSESDPAYPCSCPRGFGPSAPRA